MTAKQIDRRTALRTGAGVGLALAVGAAATTTKPVAAQTTPGTRGTVSLAMAMAMLTAGEAKARAIGVPMSITIVDESGIQKAFHRMDGNVLASVQLSQAKAYTANAFRTSTQALSEQLATNPVRLAAITNIPNVTVLPGGLPIRAEGMVIGGVGVGGGSSEQDVEVATAALAALG